MSIINNISGIVTHNIQTQERNIKDANKFYEVMQQMMTTATPLPQEQNTQLSQLVLGLTNLKNKLERKDQLDNQKNANSLEVLDALTNAETTVKLYVNIRDRFITLLEKFTNMQI